METQTEQLKRNRAFSCLECGKCTAVCPISQVNGSYSPRRLLANGIFYGGEDLINDHLLWSCLTCQLCSQRCPVDVLYSDYMREVRADAHKQGKSGQPTHSGALHAIMEMAAAPDLKQHRTDWIDGDLKVQDKGDVLYFVGCLPYYEGLFGKDFSFSPVGIAKDTVRILNRMGIEPVVRANERCCGHDLYWLGQQEKFEALARLNAEEIRASGAKTVVTACPECALTLKDLYVKELGITGFKVQHIAELLAEHVDALTWNGFAGEVTYQDPCRLGRFLGVYDEPRKVLEAIPGLTLKEMQRARRGAICCGTTNWTNCDATSKQIQKRRLTEAKATGARTLVTACPKCQIHFRCTKCSPEGEQLDIEVTDFVNIVAAALKPKGAKTTVGE
jgi:Fe-S oxidoreductase